MHGNGQGEKNYVKLTLKNGAFQLQTTQHFFSSCFKTLSLHTTLLLLYRGIVSVYATPFSAQTPDIVIFFNGRFIVRSL